MKMLSYLLQRLALRSKILIIFGSLLLSVPILLHAPKAHAFQIDAEWIDAAHIRVNSIKIEDGDGSFSSETKQFGLAKVNEWLNHQIAGKDHLYNYPDLLKLRPEFGPGNDQPGQIDAVYKTGAACKPEEKGIFSGKTSDTADIDLGGGQRDKGETADFVIGLLGFKTEGDAKAGCHFVIQDAANHKINFKLNHAERRNIWFRATGPDTLVRVDDQGKSEGDFTRGKEDANKTKFIRQKDKGSGSCPDHDAYVDVGSSDLTKDVVPATYQTCDRYNFFAVDVAGLNDQKNNPQTGGDEADGANGPAPKSCESTNRNVILGWILCSVVNFVDDSMQKLSLSVDGLLDVKQDEYDRQEYKDVWSYFKNIASFLLVGVALVAIIGQALRGE